MGGRDPYSSSKGCAELVTSAMRRSFFESGCRRRFRARRQRHRRWRLGRGPARSRPHAPRRRPACRSRFAIRNATRPWQFVLEPLRGYLMLGRALVERGHEFAEAWNFGPDEPDAVTVGEVVRRLQRGVAADVDVRVAEDAPGPHEAATLELDSTKARTRLGWEPVLTLGDAIDLTCGWYRAFHEDPAAPRPRSSRDQLRRVRGASGRRGPPAAGWTSASAFRTARRCTARRRSLP